MAKKEDPARKRESCFSDRGEVMDLSAGTTGVSLELSSAMCRRGGFADAKAMVGCRLILIWKVFRRS